MKCNICEKPGVARGLCMLHYSRWRSSGQAYVDARDNPNWKNLGKKCSEDGCFSEAVCRGLCGKHYTRLKRGLPLEGAFKNKGLTCHIESCLKNASAKGLCVQHYTQVRRSTKISCQQRPLGGAEANVPKKNRKSHRG
jgi:hypothetical protein